MSSSDAECQPPSSQAAVARGTGPTARGKGGKGKAGGRGRVKGGAAKNAVVPLDRLLRPSVVDERRGDSSITALHEDGPLLEKRDWLSVPDEFMNPLKMSVVNQFVRCIPKADFRFQSTGEEYVLVGTGNTMPENFRKWIYCMHQVNVFSESFVFELFTDSFTWRFSRALKLRLTPRDR